jgi:hypothetical protein
MATKSSIRSTSPHPDTGPNQPRHQQRNIQSAIEGWPKLRNEFRHGPDRFDALVESNQGARGVDNQGVEVDVNAEPVSLLIPDGEPVTRFCRCGHHALSL